MKGMNTLRADVPRPPAVFFGLPFYYGWVNVGIAALAMVGTLPGRTQGLGLITEPLLRDLQLSRVEFAQINLWATLAGALFGLGVGRLIDRWGSRIVLVIVAAALGITVLLMSGARGVVWLCILITLTRGFGQSALSVVSITLVGQWFKRRLNLAMSFYTVALSVGFMVAFPLVGAVVLRSGWRVAWGAWARAFCSALFRSLGFSRDAARKPAACGLTSKRSQNCLRPKRRTRKVIRCERH